MPENQLEHTQRPDIWKTLTAEERQGVCKMTDHLDDPDFYTAEELRDLADTMDWLSEGPMREAMVEIGGDRPWAWIHKHPHNGPTVQVAFQRPPTAKEFREALGMSTPPASEVRDA